MDTNSHKSKKSKTIILVDNQGNDWDTFSELAENRGYEIQILESTLEVIQYLQHNDPVSAIIIDESVSAPGPYQTFDYIKRELKLKQAVLISHNADSVIERVEKKYLGFIEKPFCEKTLDKIEFFLNKSIMGQPVQKAYSLNYLRDISDGDEEFIIDSLKIFKDSVASKLSEINISLSKKEYKTIGAIAHNIKPSFEMLESTAGKELCNRIVYQAPEKEIPDLIAALNREFNNINDQLIKDFPTLAII